MYDAIVVGGSYAGLSAALQLARARRRVAVVDGGRRRNRFADASHGFLGHDGRAPGDIVADGRAQLLAYPTVDWMNREAEAASGSRDAFSVSVGGGQFDARRLILATGVVDELPGIPGLAERWGKHVFHCPYCHGYELDRGKVGVIAVSPLSMHQALMLPDWGPTTLLLNGAFEPSAEDVAALDRRGVAIERQPIARISGEADVELGDGRVIAFCGLFTASRLSPSSPLAGQLGCAFEDGPMGPFIQTDAFKETTVSGVYACGDAARASGSVTFASGDGAMAGFGAHQSLIFG